MNVEIQVLENQLDDSKYTVNFKKLYYGKTRIVTINEINGNKKAEDVNNFLYLIKIINFIFFVQARSE